MKSATSISRDRMVRQQNLVIVLTLVVILASILFPLTASAEGTDRVDSALFGEWRWVGAETAVGMLEPLPDQDYRVSFGAEGGLQMTLESNRVRTSYSADGRRLTIGMPMMTTMAAWLPDSPAPRFLLLMENAASSFFRSGTLCVDTFAAAGTLRFERIERLEGLSGRTP